MSTQPFDPIRYKAGQRQEWNTKVWQSILEAARKHTTPDGTCRMENELLFAHGRREG